VQRHLWLQKEQDDIICDIIWNYWDPLQNQFLVKGVSYFEKPTQLLIFWKDLVRNNPPDGDRSGGGGRREGLGVGKNSQCCRAIWMDCSVQHVPTLFSVGENSNQSLSMTFSRFPLVHQVEHVNHFFFVRTKKNPPYKKKSSTGNDRKSLLTGNFEDLLYGFPSRHYSGPSRWHREM